MAKLTKLHVENFKRIQAVEIEPEGNVTIVGGMNEQGKSSLLDSISVLLQGKTTKIPQPVRIGAKKALITGVIQKDEWDAFDSMIITRTITATGNWYVKVEDKDGKAYKSPEGMLKEIFGEPVDPVEFVRMSPADRVETLKRITGLDFSKLDAKRKELYDERTLAGREVKQIEGNLASMENYGLDVEKVSISALLEDLAEIQAGNRENDKKKENLKQIEKEINDAERRLDDMYVELKQIQIKIEKAENFHKTLTENHLSLAIEINGLVYADETQIKDQISKAEEINTKIEASANFNRETEKLQKKRSEYQALTRKIDGIDANKQKQLSEINFPIDGLSFNENDVFYRDLPFNEKQLSSEELLRVSFAIAIAARPNLKNILIREGSILDENNLKLIGQMAEDAGIHVFIEVVGNDAEKATILIENGEIKESGSEYDENDFADI